MTQQIINVGIVPDDGTGDPDRTAYRKTNDNFVENYASIATAVANDAAHAGQISALQTSDTSQSAAIAALQAGLPASLITYDHAASGLTASTLQAALDEIVLKRIDTQILLSSRYGLIADGVVGSGGTDNTAAILAWIAAGQALITAGQKVQYRWVPGIYAAIGAGGFRFPGEADLVMTGATLVPTGSDLTYPRITHGNFGGYSRGNSIGISVIGNAVTTASGWSRYHDRNFIGFRALNREAACEVSVADSNYFACGFQLAADSLTEACNITIGNVSINKLEVEICSLIAATAFVSDNILTGGDINTGTGGAAFGTTFALTVSTEYDTGYHGNSGNVWDKPECQMQNVGTGYTWLPTSSANQLPGAMFYMPTSGMEYMLKTPGTTGTVEPSVIPTVAAGTRVDLTAITTIAGNVNITVSSTAGISAGWHMRGTNPLSNFPFDTYVDTVTDGTHLKMSKPAMTNSSIYRAWFTAPITDGSTVWAFVGPYRRGLLWHRDNGVKTEIRAARNETGIGEQFCVSGPYLWPPYSSISPSTAANITAHATSVNTAKDVRFLVWTAGETVVAGDCRRPLVLSTVYWECTVGGVVGGAEPTPGTVPLTQFIDNGATWIIRTLRDSLTFGSYGNYTGLNIQPEFNLRDMVKGYPVANDQTLPNMHLRAIQGTGGWDVPGYCKFASSVLTRTFLASEIILARDGLLFVAGGGGTYIGFLINTEKHRYFRISKHLGFYTKNRGVLASFDKSFAKTSLTTSQTEAVSKITSGLMAVNGAFVLADQSDNVLAPSNIIVANDVPYVFFGIQRGSTGTPVALTLKGLSVTALPYNLVETEAFQAECSTPFGTDSEPRTSPGTPISGIFKKVGEYIVNSSYVSGATPKGWLVKTAGCLGPQWAPGMTTLRGVIYTDSNRVYVPNGSYVTNTNAIVFTGALVAATSGTLTPAWAGTTGAYVIQFSDASLRNVTLTNGSAVCSWAADARGAVTATANASAGVPPTTTVQNISDVNPTSIVSGDVATMDYFGPAAVLDPDEDTNTLYAAGTTGAAPAPNCQNGLRQSWTQSANMTPAAPTNPPSIGSELTLLFTSNGIWTTTWAAPYRDGPAWAASANGQKATARFTYDGTSWQFVGGSTAFA